MTEAARLRISQRFKEILGKKVYMSDSERLQHENELLRQQIDAAQARVDAMRRPQDGGELDELAQLQSRADSLAVKLGERASGWRPGERPDAYRRRLARQFQPHSEKWRNLDLDLADNVMLKTVESEIYADAAAVAHRGDSLGPGKLIRVVEKDSAGRDIVKFHGDPLVWMQAFMPAAAPVCIINPNPKDI
jgi:colicin import membrane protein